LKSIENIKIELANKRQKMNISDNSTKKQRILEIYGSKNCSITQKTLDTAILRFVVENILPFSIVDSPSFINLMKIGVPSSIRIICRKILKEKIQQEYQKMKSAIENKLAEIEVISATADLWSKAKRY